MCDWAYSPARSGWAAIGLPRLLDPGRSPATPAPRPPSRTSPAEAAIPATSPAWSTGEAYTVAVRSCNAAAIETNTTVFATVVGKATPPDEVEALSISVS